MGTHVLVLPTVVFLPVLLLLQSRKLALPVPWIPVPRKQHRLPVVVVNLLVQLLLAVASLLPILPQLDLLPLSWLSLPLLDFKHAGVTAVTGVTAVAEACNNCGCFTN